MRGDGARAGATARRSWPGLGLAWTSPCSGAPCLILLVMACLGLSLRACLSQF